MFFRQAFQRYWRAAMVAVAALFSILAMTSIAMANADLIQKLKNNRARGTMVPVAGALAGWNALSVSEWLPRNDDSQLGVLFAVVDTTGVGGAEFWREIAARLRVVAPGTQLVGLCISDRPCALPLQVDSGLTMLEAMDPALMHTLTTAARDGRVFMFRGAQIVGGMELLADRERFAQQIANYAWRPAVGAGA